MLLKLLRSMEVKPIDIALATYEHRKRYFENYLEIGKKIKEIAKELLRDKKVRVLIFGSVAKGTFSPLSDLDILIISKKVKEKKVAKLRVKIKEGLKDFSAPIELHVVKMKTFENWYKRFLDKYVEV